MSETKSVLKSTPVEAAAAADFEIFIVYKSVILNVAWSKAKCERDFVSIKLLDADSCPCDAYKLYAVSINIIIVTTERFLSITYSNLLTVVDCMEWIW